MHNSKRLSIFCAYAHADEPLQKDVVKHLAVLMRTDKAAVWYDRMILPGAEVHKEIEDHLHDADIIILLVSPSFIQSEYCYNKEMRRAVERHMAGEARVIPIILKPTYGWQETPFGSINALPQDGKPVTKRRHRDAVLAEIAEGIGKVVEDLVKRQDKVLQGHRSDLGDISVTHGQPATELSKLQKQIREIELQSFLDKGPSAKAMFAHARKLRSKGLYAEALSVLEAALAREPNNPDELLIKAQLSSEIGHHREAIEAYSAALKIRPNDVSAMYHIARSYSLICQKDDMLVWLIRAITVEAVYKKLAQTDTDFEHYYSDPDFRKLVGLD